MKRMGQTDAGGREWAMEQWGRCELGDRRRTARVVEMGRQMEQQPGASLPCQMGGRDQLKGAYRLLNNRQVNLDKLLKPHLEATRAKASEGGVVLMIHDRTTLDFSAHPSTQGLGPVGSRRQRGMLLQSVLAVQYHAEAGAVLGLAHAQVIVRDEQPSAHNGGRRSASAEGQAWEVGVQAVGRAPEATPVRWVHVSDRESDIFEYMALSHTYGTEYVVRGRWNRGLTSGRLTGRTDGSGAEARLLDYVRLQPPSPASEYTVKVDKTKHAPARTAHLVVSWCRVSIKPPQHAKHHPPLQVWVVRAWEPHPPQAVEPVEWILLTSLPVYSLDDALRIVRYYECRWLIEDFHQCLKTGCRYEHSQLDHALDLQNLLGLIAPIAVRLLQLRQLARTAPNLPAPAYIDPLLLRLIQIHFQRSSPLTVAQFWLCVAQLGGYVGNPKRTPPGWRTLWKGWHLLSAWAQGVHYLDPPLLTESTA